MEKKGVVVNRKRMFSGFSLLLVAAVLSYSFRSQINDIFIRKFVYKLNKGDVTDERALVWMDTVRTATVWGKGREAFSNTGHAAHNTFFSILGQFGIISSILFFAAFFLGFLFLVRYKGPGRKIAFFSMVVFMLLSMVEGMLMKTTMFSMMMALFSVYGCRYKHERN